MSAIKWIFPPLSGGNRQGYTKNDIEEFKGDKLIDNLVREICQNSLDAHSYNSESHVKVIFELKRFPRKDYEIFSQYSECLDGCENYWGNEMDAKLRSFVQTAKNTLTKENIPILIASDYNTKGLIGSHSREMSSPWEALTGSEGVSVKQEGNSAGSYGIGKNAPFACSSLSMVCYNTLAEDNHSAFTGVAKLATLNNPDGEPTQGIGKYQWIDEEGWNTQRPIYDSDENSFRDCFARTETGTDVIIVGFNHESDWIINATKAVLKNFFVAIGEKRLVVELIDGLVHTKIDDGSLSQLFLNYSTDKQADMINAYQQYVAFAYPDNSRTFKVLEDEDVEIYFKSDSSYTRKTIAYFRATGMLVGTTYKRIAQNYAAVVIVRGNELGALLKDTEPPSHKKWDHKRIEALDRRKKAKKAIELINRYVIDFLKEQFEVVISDKIDAAGVGEYLPDDSDEQGEQSDNGDILKTKVKLGNIKSNRRSLGITTQAAQQHEGSEQDGDVHNHKKNPKPLPPRRRPPKPVVDNPDDPDTWQGAKPGYGSKTVRYPNLSAQRAFPVNSPKGEYKVVIVPEEDYNDMFIEFYAVGEDNKAEPLELESFKYKDTALKDSYGKVGPISVSAGKTVEFFVTFKKKEKMKLRLELTRGL